MYTFKDLVFSPHQHGFGGGLQSIFFFPNGYGISVVRFKLMSGAIYGSYTDNDQEWEIAVLTGNEDDWELTYDTPVTNDVIGHLSDEQVSDIMKQIQEL